MPDVDDSLLSVRDVLWILAQLTAGAVEMTAGLTPRTVELVEARALGLPMNQTVRLPDGRYVTCVLVLGDEDDFNRTYG